MGKRLKRKYLAHTEIGRVGQLFRETHWPAYLIDAISKKTKHISLRGVVTQYDHNVDLVGFRKALHAAAIIDGIGISPEKENECRSYTPELYHSQTIVGFLNALYKARWSDNDYEKLYLADVMVHLRDLAVGGLENINTRLHMSRIVHRDNRVVARRLPTLIGEYADRVIDCVEVTGDYRHSFAWSPGRIVQQPKRNLLSRYFMGKVPLLTASLLWQLHCYPCAVPRKYLGEDPDREDGNWLVGAGTWFTVRFHDRTIDDYAFAIKFTKDGVCFRAVPLNELEDERFVVLAHY